MKTNIIAASVIALFLVSYVSSLNILAIFPYQGRSHFLQFKVYLKALANRGHNVTVISYFPDSDSPPNYHDIVIGKTNVLEDGFPVQKSYWILLYSGLYLAHFGRENCKALVASEAVNDLVMKRPKFDIVVVEQFNTDCALGITYNLGAPVVGMTSHILMPFHYSRFGIPDNPAYVPFHFLEGGTKPTLYQRVERAIFGIYYNLLYKTVQWHNRNVLVEKYGDIPPLEDLAREIKFLLLGQYQILTGSRQLPANVIEIGGYHVPQAKPLSGDLKRFMDEAEHGVIFISFGSMIKSSTMPADKKQAILEALSKLPQRVVWRWDDLTTKFDKNKFYTSNWLPQVDILGHPKTLAFVSHAGMGGTTESIHFGVPMVAVPFYGDQPANAFSVEESGLGVHLEFNELDSESLTAALKKVLDPKFRSQVKEVSRVWHDRPMSPMDTAIYWTEYAARNANFTFRTAAADKPLYQHLNLDIYAVFLTLIILTAYIVKTTFKLLCGSRSKPKSSRVEPKEKRRSKKE